jgi:CDP-glucose 4,6-dehydratase
MNKSFWKEKKVFITGHTGFKGGWLSIWLAESGAKVTGYSLKPETSPSLFESCLIEKKINSVIGDVRDEQKLKQTIRETQPDIVFHLASQPLVLKSYDNPVETYEINLMGTVNILNAIRDITSVKSFINVTSDKCYANDENLKAFKENDSMGGFDPYSSSKACSELITAAYRASFFKNSVGIATARAGNVIGGGDWAENRIIPDFIKKIQQKQKLVIRNPESIRPWQFILEPLNGYLMLAEKLFQNSLDYAESWNFGPNKQDDKTVEWLISKFDKEYGAGNGDSFQIVSSKKSFHESKYLKLDCSKSIARLNWSPKLDIEKSISMTCDWYKNFYKDNKDMYAFTLKQIKQFELNIKR